MQGRLVRSWIYNAVRAHSEQKRLRDAVVKEHFASIKPQLLGYIFDVLVRYSDSRRILAESK